MSWYNSDDIEEEDQSLKEAYASVHQRCALCDLPLDHHGERERCGCGCYHVRCCPYLAKMRKEEACAP